MVDEDNRDKDLIRKDLCELICFTFDTLTELLIGPFLEN
jgi:hypothetical protein